MKAISLNFTLETTKLTPYSFLGLPWFKLHLLGQSNSRKKFFKVIFGNAPNTCRFFRAALFYRHINQSFVFYALLASNWIPLP